MIRHIVTWKLNKEIEDTLAVKKRIKQNLESLKNTIPQIKRIFVNTDLKESSTHDILLFTEFETIEDLEIYAKDELHLKIAKEDILPNTYDRVCLDFEVKSSEKV